MKVPSLADLWARLSMCADSNPAVQCARRLAWLASMSAMEFLVLICGDAELAGGANAARP